MKNSKYVLIACVSVFCCVVGCGTMLYPQGTPDAVSKAVYKSDDIAVCDVDGGDNTHSRWKELVTEDNGKHAFIVYNACECQRVLYSKERARVTGQRTRYRLTVTGAIIGGLGTILATSLGVVSASSDEKSPVVMGFTIGTGSVGAVGTIISAIGGTMPTQDALDQSTQEAWKHWETGMENVTIWSLKKDGKDDRTKYLETANRAFVRCASGGFSMNSDTEDTDAEDTGTDSERDAGVAP